MRQIRARIREKRGADYTETELQQLASVKLEKLMDPQGLRIRSRRTVPEAAGAPRARRHDLSQSKTTHDPPTHRRA